MQRFYGGDPLGWAQMPVGWLRAYAEMLPRIRDAEALREIELVMAGSGTMTPEGRADLLARLQTHGPAAPAAERDRPPRSTPESLAAIGIAVREVPVRG